MAINKTLKAIADPVRRQILDMLKQGDHSAGEIAAQFELTQATVSYHLKLLREAGLITVRKEQNFIYYGLNTSVFEEVLGWIYSLGGGEDESK
ncbi:autorepressor SdpR family transcription factor [Lacticaseibacillus songhuajiangensis]|jgi:DNA-binding transcriptional ArsR family regulator|uniref:autorepressor SdpR family transcription factor n=1 Tax=Lacticaseibacillus songhuajiangensis TaxID=1296539 RepID=UPI000F770C09|nr:autorepressor SdpR family transcription factor [Lacticaseibacillus songhuajiangensis]MCI1283834.1 autorepressor SdpR family transcription factor [Lacticaseibacillus songhuajiangensis]